MTVTTATISIGQLVVDRCCDRRMISTRCGLQISDASAAILLGVPTASFVSDLRSGISTLNLRDLKDRARLIINIYEGVHSLLKENDAERLWIKSPVPGLNNQSPLDVMTRGSISDLLIVKSFVDYANGR
jgi:hypothetical protein